jgi:hypothetical protein
MKKTDGIDMLKWIMVLPVVLVTYFFLMVFIKFMLGIRSVVDPHIDGAFIFSHLYTDVFCVAFAVMGGIALAPAKKTGVAIFFFIVILLTSAKYIAPILHGNHSLVAYFLLATHLAGGLIPLLIVGFKNRIHRYAQRTDGLPENRDEPFHNRRD